MAKKFPEGFWWGSATSGPQTEAFNPKVKKDKTIWDHWYETETDKFYNRKNVSFDMINRYEEYTSAAAKLNFNSVRISIQWARVLIDEGKTINNEAIEYYRNYIKSFKDKGVEVFVNLHHFDLPMWAHEIGGWTNKDVMDNYVKFAEVCFKELGDLVDKWFTFNEPIVFVEAGFWFQWWYPLEVNMKKGLQVLWNQLVAHCRVVEIFNKSMPKDKVIGSILNLTPAIPRSDSKEDVEAAKWCSLFQAKCYLDPMVNGVFPQEIIDEAKDKGYMWDIAEGDVELIKNNTVKLLGLNYYQPLRVKAPDVKKSSIDNPYYYYEPYQMPGARINKHRGWEIYPEAVYMAMKDIQQNYNNVDFYIAENGMGVMNEDNFKDEHGVIQDKYREEFLGEHLEWIHKAIAEGANCKGYHMWTFMDNWSWANAYKNRYGFVEFDLEKSKLREKASANWIRNVIKNNALGE